MRTCARKGHAVWLFLGQRVKQQVALARGNDEISEFGLGNSRSAAGALRGGSSSEDGTYAFLTLLERAPRLRSTRAQADRGDPRLRRGMVVL